MKIEQAKWTGASGWTPHPTQAAAEGAQLVLVFGATSSLKNLGPLAALKNIFRAAHIFGCSTAGETCGTQVSDDSIVATAINFEHTQIAGVRVSLTEVAD